MGGNRGDEMKIRMEGMDGWMAIEPVDEIRGK